MKSRKELSQVTARRYRNANREGKARILDDFVRYYGGRAVRFGGDEIGLVLPSVYSEQQANNIRVEAQKEVEY